MRVAFSPSAAGRRFAQALGVWLTHGLCRVERSRALSRCSPVGTESRACSLLASPGLGPLRNPAPRRESAGHRGPG